MVLRDVRKRVDEIEVLVRAGDYEAAGSRERTLYVEVLHAVAKLGGQPSTETMGRRDEVVRMSREALKVSRMDFPRWTA